MTNAELKFMETVPASLHRIAAAAEKIATELSKANKLRAFRISGEAPAFADRAWSIVEGTEP